MMSEVSKPSTRVATSLGKGPHAIPAVLDGLDASLKGQRPVLVALFASIHHSLRELLDAAQRRWPSAVVLGCTSAGEFTEVEEAKHAISGFALAGDFKVRAELASGLGHDPAAAVGEVVTAVSSSIDDYPHRTAILLLDPLSGQGEEATLLAATLLEHEYGNPIRLVGGAAGDDLSMTSALVGLGDRVTSDAIAIAMIYSKLPFGIGVQHGHRPLSEPLTVTRAEGNVVYELDGKPAWDVWREQTREAARRRHIDVDALDESTLGGFFLTYEGSLASGDAIKVRAPLVRVEHGALSFATGIPTGAVIRIAESDEYSQLRSARRAAELAQEQLGGLPVAGALVFDCICRNLLLSDAFHSAIDSISDALGNVPVAGFETYGEIALDVGDMSGFHNTTSVVLAIPSDEAA